MPFGRGQHRVEQVKDAAAFATVLAAGAAGFAYHAGVHEPLANGIATVLVADGLWRATRTVCGSRGLLAPGRMLKDYARTVGVMLRRAARFTANVGKAARRRRDGRRGVSGPRRIPARVGRREGMALTRGAALR